MAAATLLYTLPATAADVYMSGTAPSGPAIARTPTLAFEQTTDAARSVATGMAAPKQTSTVKADIATSATSGRLLDLMAATQPATIAFEFAQNGPSGGEQIYMTSKLLDARVNEIRLAYTAGAPGAGPVIPITSIALSGRAETAATPPANDSKSVAGAMVRARAGAGAAQSSSSPSLTSPPRVPFELSRALKTFTPATSPLIDDVYLSIPGIAGDTADHPGKTRVLTEDITIKFPRNAGTGMATPKRTATLTLTKKSGANTAAFAQASSQNRQLPTVTLEHVQRPAGQPETVRTKIEAKDCRLTQVVTASGATGTIDTLKLECATGTSITGT